MQDSQQPTRRCAACCSAAGRHTARLSAVCQPRTCTSSGGPSLHHPQQQPRIRAGCMWHLPPSPPQTPLDQRHNQMQLCTRPHQTLPPMRLQAQAQAQPCTLGSSPPLLQAAACMRPCSACCRRCNCSHANRSGPPTCADVSNPTGQLAVKPGCRANYGPQPAPVVEGMLGSLCDVLTTLQTHCMRTVHSCTQQQARQLWCTLTRPPPHLSHTQRSPSTVPAPLTRCLPGMPLPTTASAETPTSSRTSWQPTGAHHRQPPSALLAAGSTAIPHRV
jgi:hypothetical protein